MKPEVTILRSNPFYSIFRDGVVPVTALLPQRAKLEGQENENVWMLDLERCTPEQIEAVGTRLCAIFKSRARDVIAEMATRGLPIRESQVESWPAISVRFVL